MSYFSKEVVLKAYKTLCSLSEDPTSQGATQKVSALRYVIALDMFYHIKNRKCNTQDNNDRATYNKFVGTTVAINATTHTTNFYIPLASSNGDWNVGSNFYSVNAVKESLVNDGSIVEFPKRGGHPLLDIQSGDLIRNVHYYNNIRFYLSNNASIRTAFVVWLLRNCNYNYGNYNSVRDALSTLLTKEMVNALIPTTFAEEVKNYWKFENTKENLSPNDIEKLFHTEEKTSTFLPPFPLQQIFYGAPGTGKSYRIKEIVEQYPKENIFRTTFHPDSDYSTFVGCYKPTKVKKPVRDMAGKTALDDKKDEIFEDAITYSFVPQAFLKAYIRAWNMLDSGQPVFLIIEEINRGNCAQIFGDLFQLLDRRQDGYSDYPIKADTDLAQYLSETDVDGNDILTNPKGIADGELCLPPNLYIWGTMNTSDQSLFPIDSAFKRRWNWKYIKISDAQLNWEIQDVKDENSWYAFIEQINKVIVQVTNSADKQLGYFFCQPDMPADQDKKSTISLQRFVDKVVFYLWNDVFKDNTFGDTNLFADNNDNAISFPDFYDNTDKVNKPTTLAFIRRVMQWGKSPVELQQDSE